MRKVLCVCQRGNVRSVGLARILKDRHGMDAVAIGWQTAGPALRQLLYCWAEHIIVLEPYMVEHLPACFRGKTLVCDSGPDVYGSGEHPALLRRLGDWLAGGGLPGLVASAFAVVDHGQVTYHLDGSGRVEHGPQKLEFTALEGRHAS